MNKLGLYIFFSILLLCLPLSACAEKAPEPAVSSIPPDLESIVEPIETSESAFPVSENGESWANTESEPDLPHEPVSSYESEPAVESVPPVPQPTEASAREKSAPVQSYPERLNAVTPDLTLNREEFERELLRLINGLREQAGVEKLGIREEMIFAARIRSAEALQSFSHTRPNGSPYNTAFDEAGFSYAGKWHGENLASLNFTEGMLDEKAAALEMFNGLRDSPGHYRNMTGENFLQIGIGVSISREDGMIHIASAQLFSSI